MAETTFRDLRVWQHAIQLAVSVYRHTQRMPTSERFALTNQIRRAVVSIPSNIAEGNARYYRKDYLHFLTIARGSLAELETQLTIAEQLEFLTPNDELWIHLREVTRMLQALINSLKQS